MQIEDHGDESVDRRWRHFLKDFYVDVPEFRWPIVNPLRACNRILSYEEQQGIARAAMMVEIGDPIAAEEARVAAGYGGLTD